MARPYDRSDTEIRFRVIGEMKIYFINSQTVKIEQGDQIHVFEQWFYHPTYRNWRRFCDGLKRYKTLTITKIYQMAFKYGIEHQLSPYGLRLPKDKKLIEIKDKTEEVM